MTELLKELMPVGTLLAKARSKLPAIKTVREIIASPPAERPEIIRGVLRRGCKMSLAGPSKARKTYQLMALGVCAARGYDWLLFKTVKTKVLYINFELHDDTFYDRLQDICIGMETNIDELGDDFSYWGLRGHAAPYDEIVPMILEDIRAGGYGLVIIDPTYKILGNLDENKAGDIAKLMNELEKVVHETGCALVSANHFSKGNKAATQDGDRVSGSGVFLRDPDALFEFVPQEDSDDTNDILVASVILREFPPVEKFVVQWDKRALFDVVDLPAKMKGKPGAKEKYPPDRVKKCLEGIDDGLKSGEWLEAATEDCGIKGDAFYNIKDRLVDSGEVVFDKKTKRYSLGSAL
jgi:hypothetical protein